MKVTRTHRGRLNVRDNLIIFVSHDLVTGNGDRTGINLVSVRFSNSIVTISHNTAGSRDLLNDRTGILSAVSERETRNAGINYHRTRGTDRAQIANGNRHSETNYFTARHEAPRESQQTYGYGARPT